jgi:hypothetical protein
MERSRRKLLVLGTLRTSAFEGPVRVRDISPGGARIEGAHAPALRHPCEIELPNIGWVAAKVAWKDDTAAGLTFDAPIDPAKLQQKITGTYARQATPPKKPRKFV